MKKFLTYSILLPLVILLLLETISSTLLLHSKFGLTNPHNIAILRFTFIILMIIIICLFIFTILLNTLIFNPTVEKIAIKLVPITISQIMIITSLFLDYFLFINMFSILFFAIGNIIIFLRIYSGSLYKSFLEIKGSEALREFYVINSKDQKCLYHYDFIQKRKSNRNSKEAPFKSEKMQGEEFFPYGIEGIEKILAKITQDEEDTIKTISQEDSLILLEHGSRQFLPLTYVLITDKNQKWVRLHLDNFKTQFESNYKEILMNFNTLKEYQTRIFNSFDLIIKETLK